LGKSRTWAARSLEQDLLTTASRRGQSPNYDLLRALQVSDSTPVPVTDSALFLAKARVFGQQKTGAPINLECLRADTTLQATLTIDNYLFEDEQARAKLNFGSQREWLTNLGPLINEQTRQRVTQERAFYQRRGPSQAGNFYNQLHGLMEQMPENRFLIQVGWGGGWDSKTLAYLLPSQTRDNIVVEYRLARNYFKPGETPFPRTRRAIGRGREDEIQPVLPLGWILVEMTLRE
jgi:CRISPR-associated protein Csm5